MLLAMIEQKLSQIDDPRDKDLFFSLRDVLQSPSATGEIRHAAAGRLFSSMIREIARQENISIYNTTTKEILLKDHLPNQISTMIVEIERLLFGHPEADREPGETQTTLAHLLLKLAEWKATNYENRCIYGEGMEKKAGELLRRATSALEVWGDKDEVWLSLLELLRSEAGLEMEIREMLPLLSCRTYAALVPVSASGTPFEQENWSGDIPPREIELILAVTTVIADQTLAKISLVCKKPEIRPILSTGRFEGALLAKLARLCGTPADEHLYQ